MIPFREALGWDTHPLLLKDDATVVGACILAGKRGRYEIALGPLLDFKNEALATEFLGLISDYVKRIGGSAIEIYPNSVYQTRDASGQVIDGPAPEVPALFAKAGWKHKGFTTNYDYTANRWVFVKDLSQLHTEAELLSSYRQTTRQTIRKLEAERYSVRKLAYDELAIIKALIDSSNERNEVHNRPLSYYEHLFTAYGDAVEFLVMYYDQKIPISAGIFVSHPKELAYFHSGADSRYRQLYGGHFLQHYVMKRAIAHGVKRYNFYGVTGHFTKNPLLVYKSGFRGVVEEYVGGFVKVVNPAKHHAQKALRAPKNVLRRMLKK